ncbi:DUF1566 domain-containing protein [Legionella yabuuchiae]|uniref:DUF1566 domain-containing protein n=1 Tax=Legionella yabuuchiae TaxID=376727 RepID=UPI0010547BB6|nr:DUF1566 domain-containing protein [Legionella yabuuchiae]
MKRLTQGFLCLSCILMVSTASHSMQLSNLPDKNQTIALKTHSLFLPVGSEESLMVMNKSLQEAVYNLSLELTGTDLEHQLKITSNDCSVLNPGQSCRIFLKAIGKIAKPISVRLIGENIRPITLDVMIEELKPGIFFEGGIVYQVNPDGRSGKLCSMEDNAHFSYWGGYGMALNVLNERDGLPNSKTVAELFEEDTDFAAGLCYRYRTDSLGQFPCQVPNRCYDGWYLPSKEELRELWQNSTLAHGLIGGFSQEIYWSSTEFTGLQPYFAWAVNFTSGTLIGEAKDQPHKIRCIRSFKLS